MMFDITEGIDKNVKEMTILDYIEKMKVVYPKDEEELIDFLNRCNIKGYKVMICPRCSVVFDEEAIKDLEKIKPQQPRKVGRDDSRNHFISIIEEFLKRYIRT